MYIEKEDKGKHVSCSGLQLAVSSAAPSASSSAATCTPCATDFLAINVTGFDDFEHEEDDADPATAAAQPALTVLSCQPVDSPSALGGFSEARSGDPVLGSGASRTAVQCPTCLHNKRPTNQLIKLYDAHGKESAFTTCGDLVLSAGGTDHVIRSSVLGIAPSSHTLVSVGELTATGKTKIVFDQAGGHI